MCGQVLPEPLRGMQSRLNVLFVSSAASTTSGKWRGFKLRYRFIPESTILAPASLYLDTNERFRAECGGSTPASALSGEITSPGYPFTYPRNVSCNWLIRVNPNQRVYIRLLHLELSPTVAECERASLLLIDGYRYEIAESSSQRKLNERVGLPDVKYCGGRLYYNEEGMKSYLSNSNRVIVR